MRLKELKDVPCGTAQLSLALQERQGIIPGLDHDGAAGRIVGADPLGGANPGVFVTVDVHKGAGIKSGTRRYQRQYGTPPASAAHGTRSPQSEAEPGRPHAKQRQHGQHIAQELCVKSAHQAKVDHEPHNWEQLGVKRTQAQDNQTAQLRPAGPQSTGKAGNAKRKAQRPFGGLPGQIHIWQGADVLSGVGPVDAALHHQALTRHTDVKVLEIDQGIRHAQHKDERRHHC